MRTADYESTQQIVLANVDWVAWSVKGIDCSALPCVSTMLTVGGRRYCLEVLGGTASYSWRGIVWTDEGRKLATILAAPKSRLFDPTSGLVEVANECLYQPIGWHGAFAVVERIIPCHRVGLSRLDICWDFCPTERQLDIIEGLANGRYYVANKRNRTCWHSVSTGKNVPLYYNGTERPHCISWGHKTTAVKWKLYYKSKELAEPNQWLALEKPHIVAAWERAGLPDRWQVWRLEVSIKHGNGYSVDGVRTISPLGDLAEWERVAAAMRTSRFVIRAAEGHAERRNDTEVVLFGCKRARVVQQATPIGTRETDYRHVLVRKLLEYLQDSSIANARVIRDGVADLLRVVVAHDHLDAYVKAITNGETADDVIARVANYFGDSGNYNCGYGAGMSPNENF